MLRAPQKCQLCKNTPKSGSGRCAKPQFWWRRGGQTNEPGQGVMPVGRNWIFGDVRARSARSCRGLRCSHAHALISPSSFSLQNSCGVWITPHAPLPWIAGLFLPPFSIPRLLGGGGGEILRGPPPHHPIAQAPPQNDARLGKTNPQTEVNAHPKTARPRAAGTCPAMAAPKVLG